MCVYFNKFEQELQRTPPQGKVVPLAATKVDNDKLGLKNGKLVTFVQIIHVGNIHDIFSSPNFQASSFSPIRPASG